MSKKNDGHLCTFTEELYRFLYFLNKDLSVAMYNIVMAACMANDYHNNMDLHCSQWSI